MTQSDFRIAAHQNPRAKAKQALMIASNELKVFTFYSPFALGDPQQRASVLAMIAGFGATIPVPDDATGVYYLIVFSGVPALIPEADVLGFVFGIVLAKLGVDAARRVSYRPEMLPSPKE